MKNILLLIFIFYALVLLQTSFLVHFNVSGVVPDFILLAVMLINFFEKPDKKLGIISAFFGGFFLDAFSGNFFGYYVLILVATSFFLKYILRKYIKIWT